MIIPGMKMSEAEIERSSRALGNDLTAWFRLMRSDLTDLLAKADNEGWSEDRFVDEAAKLGEGDGEAE